MEGNVYLCGWERKGESFKLWLRSNPRIKGTGATLNAARESLWKSVMKADPKLSDSDVWDYIYASVGDKLTLPAIFQDFQNRSPGRGQ